ncbi:MAG: tetratricopeptide repeat protein, partial [Flammeovirgaceae bacterium]
MKYILHFMVFGMLVIGGLQAQQLPKRPNKTDKNGLRQGEWVVLYDEEWMVTTDSSLVDSYRFFEYKDDKPIGVFTGYYLSGKIQLEGRLLADRPVEIFDGEVVWYGENGIKKKSWVFDHGKAMDEIVYDSKGNINWETLIHKGTAHHQEQNYDEAFAFFEKAVAQAIDEYGKGSIPYATGLINLAYQYRIKTQYAKAEKLYLEAKALYGAKLGKEHAHYKFIIFNLADLYTFQKKYTQAEALYLERKEIYEASKDEQPQDYIKSLNTLADFYQNCNYYQKAELMYQEVMDVYETKLSKEHLGYFCTFNNLATLYQDQKLYSKSEKFYLEALEFFRKQTSEDYSCYTTCLTNLSHLYVSQGFYDQALPFLQESTAIHQQLMEQTPSTQNLLSYADALNQLASLYQDLGWYVKAKELYVQAKKICEEAQGKANEAYVRYLGNLADVTNSQGDYDEAERLYLEAQTISVALALENTSILMGLANVYRNKGQFAKAESLYKKAIDICKKTMREDHPIYLTHLNNLAILYASQNLLEKAETVLLKIIEVSKEGAIKNPEYVTSLINLATIYRLEGLFDEAEYLYLKGIHMAERLIGKRHPMYGHYVSNIAALYLLKGEYKKSEQYYVEAKKVFAETLGKEGVDYARCLQNLAINYKHQNLYVTSEKLFKEAKLILEQVLDKEHPEYGTLLFNLASLYKDLGLFAEAELHFKHSIDIIMNNINRTFISLSEKEKSQYLEQAKLSLESFYLFALQRVRTHPRISSMSYDFLLQQKSLLFNTQIALKTKLRLQDDEQLKDLYNEWLKSRRLLARWYGKADFELTNSETNMKLEEEKANELEKQLSTQSKLFANSMNSKKYTWQMIRKTLKPKEAAVELVRVNDWEDSIFYMAMIITPETKDYPAVVVLENGNELESTYFKTYQQTAEQNIENPTDSSYQHYWGKIAQKLKGIKKVYLSADGVYYRMNLQALKNPETGNYLADELDIQLVTS